MDALYALTPRQIDHRVVEPVVAFEEVDQAAHSAHRCPVTCDAACIPTSFSRAVDPGV